MVYTVKSAPTNDVVAVSYKKKESNNKKKNSKGLKGFSNMADEATKAADKFTTNYRKRHQDSHSKKRDGWLRKLDDNVYKSTRSSVRSVKLDKLLGF